MGKDILLSLNKQSNLPQELPDNLVYWIRCETRVKELQGEQHVITNEELREFYKQKITLFDTLNRDREMN